MGMAMVLKTRSSSECPVGEGTSRGGVIGEMSGVDGAVEGRGDRDGLERRVAEEPKVDAVISAELAVGVGNADSVMVDAVGCADKGVDDGAEVVRVSPAFASVSSLTSVEAFS